MTPGCQEKAGTKLVLDGTVVRLCQMHFEVLSEIATQLRGDGLERIIEVIDLNAPHAERLEIS